jgi:alpha-L-arabinofuranosidase
MLRNRFGQHMLIAALLVLGLAQTTTWAQPASLTVQVDQPGVKISPTLYGIFFEEINLAGDGGLYAELVRNRSFEDSEKPDHWTLLTIGGAKGEMAVEARQPATQFKRRALRLKIAETGAGKVAVANGGYFGISVVKDAVYSLSLAARTGDGFTGPLAVALESADGKTVYAQCAIAGAAAEWKTLQASLKATGTDPKARLVIGATQPGTVWLDMVSLFPRQTWKDRPNGMRPDLAQLLDGLRPSFVRFPGGCWVEGDKLEFATRWKRTIGELAERWTQWNIWSYHSTNGLGFHEYLQLSEDLGAEPLFVINVGMSHQQNVPMDQMGEWVQDALDAIEYANGPADSKWGALRAKAGHPAPFNLKYIEIGNENGGPAYQERYVLFYDALKAKDPQLQLIGDVPTDKRPADIVDEHYYSSPEFFIANANKYDTYDRKKFKIYVGEYAVTVNCGKGNLRGALGEAAFMTGMERNSDVVVMASYAPLFANVDYKRWNPDLINFDSARAYGTPSYHVQKMFSEARGDVVLPVDLKSPLVDAGPTSGAIGVGTWVTQAEYKDLQVTQGDKVLFQTDFADGTKGWRLHGGDWKAKDGVLQQTNLAENVRAMTGDKAWNNYTYSLKARKLGGAEGFLILFRVRDDDAKSWWNIGGWGNRRHAVEIGGVVGNEVPGKIETGRWYDIRIELQDAHLRCYLDGKLIHDIVYPSYPALHAVASRVNATGDVLLKVVNVSEKDQSTKLDLRGIQGVQSSASATLLTGKPEDENTVEEPTRVAPTQGTISNAGSSFVHSFPANSVTVLRLKAAK